MNAFSLHRPHKRHYIYNAIQKGIYYLIHFAYLCYESIPTYAYLWSLRCHSGSSCCTFRATRCMFLSCLTHTHHIHLIIKGKTHWLLHLFLHIWVWLFVFVSSLQLWWGHLSLRGSSPVISHERNLNVLPVPCEYSILGYLSLLLSFLDTGSVWLRQKRVQCELTDLKKLKFKKLQ